MSRLPRERPLAGAAYPPSVDDGSTGCTKTHQQARADHSSPSAGSIRKRPRPSRLKEIKPSLHALKMVLLALPAAFAASPRVYAMAFAFIRLFEPKPFDS